MSFTEQQIKAALSAAVDPDHGQGFRCRQGPQERQDRWQRRFLRHRTRLSGQDAVDAIRKQVIAAVRTLPGIGNVRPTSSARSLPHSVQLGVKLMPGVKNIITVAYGKGGVGKTTTAVNLGAGAGREGAKVGILDADILWAVASRIMLGIAEGTRPEVDKSQNMDVPLKAHGVEGDVQVGFMIDDEHPGGLARADGLPGRWTQLLGQTNWGEIGLPDRRHAAGHRRYPVVDVAEGAGDRRRDRHHATGHRADRRAQGPEDVREGEYPHPRHRSENMSIHICSKCGHEEHIFGTGGGEQMGKDYNVEFLGSLPLELAIREMADSGKPTVVGAPDSRAAEIYRGIARRVAVKVAEKAKDMTSKFPNIVVQNT